MPNELGFTVHHVIRRAATLCPDVMFGERVSLVMAMCIGASFH